MRKLIQTAAAAGAAFLLPGLLTVLLTGNVTGDEKTMGITVTLADGSEIDGEEYVRGMAASELSYVEEEEALKAWMIVCRTNFVKAAGTDGEVKEEELAFDYLSGEELEKYYGRKKYLELLSGLEAASEETFGKAVYYGGEPIDALSHPVSIGKTVSSQEMYGVDVPYLVSVSSSQDVESDDYATAVTLSYAECAEKLAEAGYEETEKRCKNKLAVTKQTENGFVQELGTKKNTFTGEEWKEIFGLPSTHFYLEEYEGQLRMVALGKGHCMGMSLYGENVLAGRGWEAEEILSYYYPGTEVETMAAD